DGAPRSHIEGLKVPYQQFERWKGAYFYQQCKSGRGRGRPYTEIDFRRGSLYQWHIVRFRIGQYSTLVYGGHSTNFPSFTGRQRNKANDYWTYRCRWPRRYQSRAVPKKGRCGKKCPCNRLWH